MRAHSQRRVIWLLDVALGAALVAVLAWYFLDVRGALAKEEYLRPGFADDAIEEFKRPDATGRSATRPPVTKEMLAEVDKPVFMKDGSRYHWAYSGPMPPAPPETKPEVRNRGPVEDDLAKLGRVVVMGYFPADEGEEIAKGSRIYWEFAKTKNRATIKVGEFLKESPKEREDPGAGGIKITNVRLKPPNARLYEILYEVYDDPNEPPLKSGVYVHDGNLTLDPAVQRRVKDGADQASAAAEAPPPAVREEGGVVVVGGTDTPARTPASASSAVNPTVEWEGLNRARVEFDQSTWDYFRSGDADSLASSVKTQEARDPSGNVIGLEITGISSDTPADKFDIKQGDILVSINDQPVKSRSDAINVAQRIDPDTSLVKVVVDRRGRLITFNIDPRDPKTRRRAATTLGRDLPER